MGTYSEEESDAIRGGLMAAVALVSKADSGFIAMFKESAAAGKTLQSLPADLKEIFSEFDMPRVKRGGELELLREAVRIADSKDSATGQAYRDAVREATSAAAEASKGISDVEQGVLDQIEAILSEKPAASTTYSVEPDSLTSPGVVEDSSASSE